MSSTWTATMWVDDVAQADHESEGLLNLIWQYIDKPRMRSFLSAFLAQIQSIEDVAYEVLVGRTPHTAIGTQLDTLGKIIAFARPDVTEDEYRLFIIAKMFANLADGKLEEAYEILERCGVTERIRGRDYPHDQNTLGKYGTGCRVAATGVSYPGVTAQILRLAKPAGAPMDFVYSRLDADSTFRFSSDPYADNTNPGTGWGSDIYTADGGAFSGMER